MKLGDKIEIKDKKHPWHGERGKLESYGAYGLPCLNLEGWLIRLDIGHSTYAKSNQIEGEQS